MDSKIIKKKLEMGCHIRKVLSVMAYKKSLLGYLSTHTNSF